MVCAHLAPFVRSAYLSPGENMIVLKFYRRIKRENCFLMPRCVFSVRLRRDRERQYTKCNRDGIKIEKVCRGNRFGERWALVSLFFVSTQCMYILSCTFPVHKHTRDAHSTSWWRLLSPKFYALVKKAELGVPLFIVPLSTRALGESFLCFYVLWGNQIRQPLIQSAPNLAKSQSGVCSNFLRLSQVSTRLLVMDWS